LIHSADGPLTRALFHPLAWQKREDIVKNPVKMARIRQQLEADIKVRSLTLT